MRYFISLVQNEWMKVNSKRQVIYFYASMVIITLLILFQEQHNVSKSSSYPCTAFFGDALFISFIIFPIFIMIISTRIIVDEYRDGTIKQLLIRPASRTMVLVSKMTTAILIILSVYACVVLFNLLVGIMFFDFVPFSSPKWSDELKIVIFQMPTFLFYSFLTIFVAVLTRSLSLSIVISFIIRFLIELGPFGRMLFKPEKWWYKYVIFPNLGWAPYFDNSEASSKLLFPGASFGFSVTIFVIYIAALFGLSALIFNKRDV